jgi:hypothetical protein
MSAPPIGSTSEAAGDECERHQRVEHRHAALPSDDGAENHQNHRKQAEVHRVLSAVRQRLGRQHFLELAGSHEAARDGQ